MKRTPKSLDRSHCSNGFEELADRQLTFAAFTVIRNRIKKKTAVDNIWLCSYSKWYYSLLCNIMFTLLSFQRKKAVGASTANISRTLDSFYFLTS